MGFLPEVELGDSFGPFAAFLRHFGFIPNLFRAQTLLPHLIAAEAEIADAVLIQESALSRRQKECILLAVAAANRNTYCVTAHCQMLRSLDVPDATIGRIIDDHHSAGLTDRETALLDFALKLNGHPMHVGPGDASRLRQAGCTDEEILETILVTGLTRFLCTLSVGLGAVPDFEPRSVESAPGPPRPVEPGPHAHGPYLRFVDASADEFPPFAFFQERFGFIPNIFRAQTLRPDVLWAEAEVVRRILLAEDVLSRKRKEYILLAVSASNLNTYCVAVHCEMLRGLGVPEDVSDQIALDHRRAGLDAADTALLDFALKLAQRPAEFGAADIESLRDRGFEDAQILEALAMTALTQFLNTLQRGLGTVPDVEPRPALNLAMASRRPTEDALAASARESGDPDTALVVRVREGDMEAFADLIRRHGRGIHRLLVAVGGNVEDAEDAAQTAFLKAYLHIGEFRGESRFATWLTRIALNEAMQRRRRQRIEIGAEIADVETADAYRPRHVQAWADDPESLYTRAQLRELIDAALERLPEKYRVPVILRDIEQLSTREAAEALGMGVPALKTRLLRGRLMLREALAPHFASKAGEVRRG